MIDRLCVFINESFFVFFLWTPVGAVFVIVEWMDRFFISMRHTDGSFNSELTTIILRLKYASLAWAASEGTVVFGLLLSDCRLTNKFRLVWSFRSYKNEIPWSIFKVGVVYSSITYCESESLPADIVCQRWVLVSRINKCGCHPALDTFNKFYVLISNVWCSWRFVPQITRGKSRLTTVNVSNVSQIFRFQRPYKLNT